LTYELVLFHKQIENDNVTDEGTITDSEHAVSPEIMEDVGMEADQFFFVSMDDQDSPRSTSVQSSE
jgi:hypothetical protein